ncbi:YdeI/OmpD-associated family protein [Candidatus Woesearchaeota archaeon]|nr:YdeI/OmpD-associated family protein [Nanoarchaeota archaeon]MCB9370794.1 YdeI/OmpD-associated family protein [Candidatus Woesearchaeota archaeon]USN43895.1 MAG: YdeI/OmpD-associated family protein [Candidatus Woesearchaeota archaeon]
MKVKISDGTVHSLPADVKLALVSDPVVLELWESNTPLGRNEYICWICSAKKKETREKRIEWMFSNLRKGKKRPCCWPGCPHREKGSS